MELLKASLCVVLILLAAFQGYGLRSADAYSSSSVLLISTHAVDGEVVISPNQTEGQVGDFIEWHVSLDILPVLLFATHVKIVVDVDQTNSKNPWGNSSARESPMIPEDIFGGWNWAPNEPTNTSGLFPFAVEIYYEIDPDIFMRIWHGNGTIHLTRFIIVPDDYPAIQEAINAANDGDTVFVRNGTYYENVVVNKPVSVVGEDKEYTVIDGGGAGTVIEIDSDNVTVSGFEVRNCSMTGDDWGITLNHSSKSVVESNIIESVLAIRVMEGSENRIIGNRVVGNDDSCVFYGLQLVNTSGNVVANNILSSDCHLALTMYNSTDNRISFNYISGHFVPFPFIMEKSNNNKIVGNTMWQPAPLFGGHICFTESNSNILYHNSFLADEGPNTILTDGLSANSWDNGCEGNYWSSYNGTDLDSDGVGDTYLPWEGVDDYPLMSLYWNPGDIDHDLDVDIFDVVKCAAAYGSTPSDARWNPHCDIAEPYGVINIFDIVTIAMSYGEEYTP